MGTSLHRRQFRTELKGDSRKPAAVHDDGTVVATGCDDQFEFEFALDLLLEGIARLHAQGWLPPGNTGGAHEP